MESNIEAEIAKIFGLLGGDHPVVIAEAQLRVVLYTAMGRPVSYEAEIESAWIALEDALRELSKDPSLLETATFLVEHLIED